MNKQIKQSSQTRGRSAEEFRRYPTVRLAGFKVWPRDQTWKK